MQAVYNFINNRRFQEAVNLLNRMPNRTAEWYYLSGAANAGLAIILWPEITLPRP